ncbi:MAG: VOC family protein [Acidimicrobiia bacterium]
MLVYDPGAGNPITCRRPTPMLLDGVNHVAILTQDTDRLCSFYQQVFEAKVSGEMRQDGFRLTFLDIGPGREFNVFQVEGNTEAERQTPMFGRGRIDHLGLQAVSVNAFREIRTRLMACGASDGFVTDFGPVLSVFFTDPDGLEGEVCVPNPEAVPGVMNPPGTPAAGYG